MVNLKSNPKTVFVVSVILALVIGLSIGRLNPSLFNKKPPDKQAAPTINEDIYMSQNATIHGVITKINGNKISVEAEGKTKEIEVLDTLIVNKLNKKPVSGPIASDSAKEQLKTVELNKEVLITLRLKDGVYKVVTISEVPPPPPAPK